MKRRWIVYSLVNIVQFSAVFAGWSYVHDPVQARAAAGWRWPLVSTVVDRPFQPPKSAWGAGHRGVDLRGTEGQDVLAAGAGTVAYSGLLAGKGVVVVKHADGLRTTYEPVVDGPRVGTEVDAGDRIGHLAAGHASCRLGTSCLHWGLLRGKTYLDPLRLVLGGRIRLLPVAPQDRAHPAGAVTDGLRVQASNTDDPLARARTVEAPPSVKRQFVNGAVNLLLLGAMAYGVARGAWRTVRWVRRRRRA
jgi:murein DD-endopeptidase MepM/ murein hydrolase activator NlpD